MRPVQLRSRLKRLISFRRRRERLFAATFFADPSWDIMLELALSAAEDRQISISAIGLTSGLAPTTVLRHLAKLEEDGIVQRQPDPADRRRSNVSLTDAALEQMQGLIAELLPDLTDSGELRALANDLRAVADELDRQVAFDG